MGRKRRLPKIHSNIKTFFTTLNFYKILLLNTSSQTPARWEDYCWNRQGVCDLLLLPWCAPGSHSGTHTDLFSRKEAAFQRCEGSGMRTLALINPLPLLEGSLPNSPLKETLVWSHPCLVKWQHPDDVIVAEVRQGVAVRPKVHWDF